MEVALVSSRVKKTGKSGKKDDLQILRYNTSDEKRSRKGNN